MCGTDIRRGLEKGGFMILEFCGTFQYVHHLDNTLCILEKYWECAIFSENHFNTIFGDSINKREDPKQTKDHKKLVLPYKIDIM